MKPHEKNKSEKEGEIKDNKKEKGNKMLGQKMKRGEKKLDKSNKKKEPNIKILSHKLLAFTLSYLMLAP
jgi:hypothetical protein